MATLPSIFQGSLDDIPNLLDNKSNNQIKETQNKIIRILQIPKYESTTMLTLQKQMSKEKFRASSQSTNDSIDSKKQLSNSESKNDSRRITLESPLSLSHLTLSQSADKKISSDYIIGKKRSIVSFNPLESIAEQRKLNFKNYMSNQIKMKNQQLTDKLMSKLKRLNTPFEEQLAFPSKNIHNQIKSLQRFELPCIPSLQKSDQESIPQQKKYIEVNENVLKFNIHFKNINKIIDSNCHFSIENTLDIAMLSATSSSNILPKKFGLLDNFYQLDSISQSQKTCLDLSNQNLSEGYAKMISLALQHTDMSQLKSILLKNSNLTTKSLTQIAANLPHNIQEINLEQNHLGTDCYIGIASLLQYKVYPYLKSLNLENNKIGDLGLHSLHKALLNCSLSILNISNNNLTDASSECISTFLKESQEINELYLHWNKFSSQGGIAIAKGIEANTSLQVLDLSYNGLGNPKGVKAALKIIKSCTTKFTGVKHLDLSFNMIQKEETQEISSFLQKNTTIFGLHYVGNEGDWIVDSRGFLKMTDSIHACEIREEQIHYGKQRIQGLKCVKKKLNQLINHDICWICDGWQEVRFQIIAETSNAHAKLPVFLHLDFENYRPHYMDADPNNKNTFVLKRMCPPKRRIQFFFSDPTQKVLYYSHDYPSMSFMKNKLLGLQFYNKDNNSKMVSNFASPKVSCKKSRATNFFQKKYFKLQYLDTTEIEYQEPFLVNWIETLSNSPVIITEHEYEPLVECKPRWPETYFKINFTNEWCFEKSLFSTYARDSDDLIDKCFEFDWEQSRLDKITNPKSSDQSSKDGCKDILRREYNLLRIVYKHFASLGMVGDIPAVAQNKFSNIAIKMKISDGKLFKLSDLDYNFITVNSSRNREKNYRNPDKAMIRFEFIEVFARIAIDKYIRNGVCKNAQDSLELFFSNSTMKEKIQSIEDPQLWRDTRYWNEQCDTILANQLEFIQELWNKWANSKKAEKRSFQNTKTMNIYEFTDMVKNFNLLDDLFTERDIPLAFNLAMMTQVDEINNDRFIQMTFVEFLEALARVAEKKSLEPLGSVDGTYTMQEKQEIRLEYKLESMLYQMKERYQNTNNNNNNNQKDKKQQNNNNQGKEKQNTAQQQQEISHQPLVPSIQLSNQQQKSIPQINSSRARFESGIKEQQNQSQSSYNSLVNES